MSSLKDRLAEARSEESGVTLLFVALSLVVMMGMAGFAVDLGWLYWNGIKIQHGADAAALSGVVYQPGDRTTSYAEARGAASENGYSDLASGTTVTPSDFSESPPIVDNANQLAVTVTHEVPTFFMKVFGINTVTINRFAIAEYALPLAMGSDLPYFGTDPGTPGREPNFWANIHGYNTGRRMGDRFASQCINGESGSGCTPNVERRETVSAGMNNGLADFTGGYLYGVEVPPGASNLSIDIFDGPFYRGGNDNVLVGDNPQNGDGPTTTFMLYAPDPTPLDTTDGNVLLCTRTFGPQDSFADFNGDGSVNGGDDQDGDSDLDWDDVRAVFGASLGPLWDNLCTVNAGEGIYPLRVIVADPGGTDDRGLNRYSMRATTSGPDPRFYGLGDVSIYVNFAGSSAQFNLAEVPEVHAGRELVIELWDPDSGNNGISILMPDGSGPPCTWTSTDGRSGAPDPCNITFTTGFDNAHMQIRIDIPNDYTCAADCWWDINVSYPGGANDTTTWSARIEGNPVRLVE